MSTKALIIYLFILLVGSGNASVIDWIWGGHHENAAPKPTIGGLPIVKIPFEITADDEKFLREAKNYTSLKLAHLDDCQHHVSNEFIKFINVISNNVENFIRLKQCSKRILYLCA